MSSARETLTVIVLEVGLEVIVNSIAGK